MGVNGDVSISTLKGATSILSDYLFDHAPGSPNEVYMSDFLVDAVGNLSNQINGDPTELIQDTQGTHYAADPQHEFQDVVEVVVEATRASNVTGNSAPGEFWPEQIGLNGSSLEITFTNNLTVIDRTTEALDQISATDLYVVLRAEVDGLGGLDLTCRLKDGLNTDADQYNIDLDFTDTDVVTGSDVPLVYEGASSYAGSGDTIDVSFRPYDPQDELGDANNEGYYKVVLDPGAITGDQATTNGPSDSGGAIGVQLDGSDYSDGTNVDIAVEQFIEQGGTKTDVLQWTHTIGGSGSGKTGLFSE